MVKFQGSVTVEGWSVSFESRFEGGEEINDFEIAAAEKLAQAFIEARCKIDWEVDTERCSLTEEANGQSHTEEAECITD